jgi:chitodextrinase
MNSMPFRTGLAALALGVLAAVAVPAGPAAADTPLSTPGTPVATQVTTTSITLSWAASSGPVANYTVQIIDGSLVPWHDLATTTATSLTQSGLSPDTVYEYRVIANPVVGSGYAVSSPSGYIAVTTAPLPDSTPPTTPGTPVAYSVSTVAVTLNFPPSTDNNRVAGYVAQVLVNGVWTDAATNNITTIYLRNLTPNTSYTVAVVAFDPNGNRSPRSSPLTFTTRQLQPQPTCKVQLITFFQGYLLTVTVENMTASTVLTNWTITFTLPAAHTPSYPFNSTLTRNGDHATLVPASYIATIGPGGTANVGFNATYPAGSPLPSGFQLNGAIACA